MFFSKQGNRKQGRGFRLILLRVLRFSQSRYDGSNLIQLLPLLRLWDAPWGIESEAHSSHHPMLHQSPVNCNHQASATAGTLEDQARIDKLCTKRRGGMSTEMERNLKWEDSTPLAKVVNSLGQSSSALQKRILGINQWFRRFDWSRTTFVGKI